LLSFLKTIFFKIFFNVQASSNNTAIFYTDIIFNYSDKETKKKEIKSNSAYIRKLSEIDMKKFNLINDPIQLIKEYGKENNIEEDIITLSIERMRDTIYSEE
jgi:hypothetical protein